MYFPVSFSRDLLLARRRAISFWRSVSWGAAGSGSVVAMGTSSTGAAASAGASPGSDRSRTRRQRAHGRARGVGGASAAAWLTSASRAILRLHICDGSMAWRLTEASRRDSVEGRLISRCK